MADEKALWYVVHTYSGYENKVANDLVKTVENNGMGDLIQEVTVPIEEVVEIRNGKPHTIQHKLFPGYVLVKMIKTTETWYVVRNTRGVTGFVGPGSEPIPLTDEEYERMTSCQGTIRIDLEPGDNVRIKTGSVENAIGTVEEINVPAVCWGCAANTRARRPKSRPAVFRRLRMRGRPICLERRRSPKTSPRRTRPFCAGSCLSFCASARPERRRPPRPAC